MLLMEQNFAPPLGPGRYLMTDSGIRRTKKSSQRLTTTALTAVSVKPSALFFALLLFSFP